MELSSGTRENSVAILFAVLMVSVLFAPALAQTEQECETCGMTIDAIGQERFKIIDANSVRHYACCPICSLMLLKTYKELNITTFCDLNGPTYPITLAAKQSGANLTFSPKSALILIGNDCAENRIVYDPSAADALLAPPNNGTSKWLSPSINTTVSPGATRMSIVQAIIKYLGVTPTVLSEPEPSQPSNSTSENNPEPTNQSSPTPNSNPKENITRECEACGMTVTADDLLHFKITDGTGTQHFVECCMCALNLIKRYDTLRIQAFCDWYGPTYPITVESTGYGAQTLVTPQSAMYLYAGTCENNRLAYNQTAADELKLGYSPNTSLLQQHDWASTPQVITIAEAIALYNPRPNQQDSTPDYTIALIATGLTIVSAASVFAVWKIRKK